MCPGRSNPFYILNYYIKWVTTSWTHSKGKEKPTFYCNNTHKTGRKLYSVYCMVFILAGHSFDYAHIWSKSVIAIC